MKQANIIARRLVILLMWSFLLLVFAGALYLIFRFYEMAKELFS